MAKSKTKMKFTDINTQKLWDEISNESDRGCILMVAAILDGLLEMVMDAAIRKKGTFNYEKRTQLLGPMGPLGNFSARISMSHLFGHIQPWMYENLEIIRDIRNDLAHGYTKVSFEQEDLKAKVMKLKHPRFDPEAQFKKFESATRGLSLQQVDGSPFSLPRFIFIITAIFLTFHLQGRLNKLTKIKSDQRYLHKWLKKNEISVKEEF